MTTLFYLYENRDEMTRQEKWKNDLFKWIDLYDSIYVTWLKAQIYMAEGWLKIRLLSYMMIIRIEMKNDELMRINIAEGWFDLYYFIYVTWLKAQIDMAEGWMKTRLQSYIVIIIYETKNDEVMRIYLAEGWLKKYVYGYILI